MRKLRDEVVVYNESAAVVNGTSSVESAQLPNKKLNTSQSIVEVHPPPRNITSNVILEKPSPPAPAPPQALPPAPALTMPALPAPPVIPVLPAPALSSVSSTVPSSPPPPPPPPPPSTPLTPVPPLLQTQKSTTSITSTSSKAETHKSNASNLEQVHEELKFVLTMFREKKAGPPRDDNTQQEIWLNQHSTPQDVQAWLTAKGFAAKICKQFENMNGTELFNLTRRQLEQYCGASEGSRLNGQLTLARNESGYKTARSSELKQILDKARRRAEELNDKDDVKQ